MTILWGRALLVFWLLCQALGIALPPLAAMPVRETSFQAAWGERQPTSNDYDAVFQACVVYDAEMLPRGMEERRDSGIPTEAASGYDCAPGFLFGEAGGSDAPPTIRAGFLAAKGGKSLLPGEGAVGTFDDLIAAGSKGDNLTPHHIPSANHMAGQGVSHERVGPTIDNRLCKIHERVGPTIDNQS